MTRDIELTVGDRILSATLSVPESAQGLVIFAHGSGSGRKSPRNQYVARVLNEGGIATLLLDLLTPQEERVDDRTAELRFDIALLARRVAGATEWAGTQTKTADLPIGYFGASTGAGAALVAAAERDDVCALVSRGGRPDLAGAALERVTAPTLLIVGERDPVVIDLNRRAAQLLEQSETVIVPGASHLFEEPGALEHVAELAKNWFTRNLVAR